MAPANITCGPAGVNPRVNGSSAYAGLDFAPASCATAAAALMATVPTFNINCTTYPDSDLNDHGYFTFDSLAACANQTSVLSSHIEAYVAALRPALAARRNASVPCTTMFGLATSTAPTFAARVLANARLDYLGVRLAKPAGWGKNPAVAPPPCPSAHLRL
jgi:hypothetical protein